MLVLALMANRRGWHAERDIFWLSQGESFRNRTTSFCTMRVAVSSLALVLVLPMQPTRSWTPWTRFPTSNRLPCRYGLASSSIPHFFFLSNRALPKSCLRQGPNEISSSPLLLLLLPFLETPSQATASPTPKTTFFHPRVKWTSGGRSAVLFTVSNFLYIVVTFLLADKFHWGNITAVKALSPIQRGGVQTLVVPPFIPLEEGRITLITVTEEFPM